MKAAKLITVQLMALVIMLSGCGKISESDLGKDEKLPGESQTGSNPCFPKSIVALIDKSMSTPGHSIPQPTLQDFKPLIDQVCNCGGSLAVGLITAHSDKVFVTLRVFDEKPKKPVEPNEEHYPNDFDYRDAYTAYQKEASLYSTRIADWKNAVKSKANVFEAELVKLLKHPVDAKQTDINNALNKAELYHSNYPECKPYTLIISDGKDDVSAKLSEVNGGADVFLVYGSNSPAGQWTRKYDYSQKADLETAIRDIKHGTMAENDDDGNFKKK